LFVPFFSILGNPVLFRLLLWPPIRFPGLFFVPRSGTKDIPSLSPPHPFSFLCVPMTPFPPVEKITPCAKSYPFFFCVTRAFRPTSLFRFAPLMSFSWFCRLGLDLIYFLFSLVFGTVIFFSASMYKLPFLHMPNFPPFDGPPHPPLQGSKDRLVEQFPVLIIFGKGGTPPPLFFSFSRFFFFFDFQSCKPTKPFDPLGFTFFFFPCPPGMNTPCPLLQDWLIFPPPPRGKTVQTLRAPFKNTTPEMLTVRFWSSPF